MKPIYGPDQSQPGWCSVSCRKTKKPSAAQWQRLPWGVKIPVDERYSHENPASVCTRGINDVAPFAFFEDIQTGRRKGLMQENLIILLQDFLRLLIDVMERPLLTQGD